jgi:hypothetical protein
LSRHRYFTARARHRKVFRATPREKLKFGSLQGDSPVRLAIGDTTGSRLGAFMCQTRFNAAFATRLMPRRAQR